MTRTRRRKSSPSSKKEISTECSSLLQRRYVDLTWLSVFMTITSPTIIWFWPIAYQSDKVSVTPASGKFCTLGSKERMTTPPTYLTESELISRMEKYGIGTDASIATHIENVLKRNYVELIPGRKLKPSRLGLVLAQGYHLIDNSLVLPQVRSDIEGQCNKIAKGIADKVRATIRIDTPARKKEPFCTIY